MLNCSLINKLEANIFGNILVQLLQYYMTYLNIFLIFLSDISIRIYACFVKLMDCGCILFRHTQCVPRGGNLPHDYTYTKPEATYKLFLTHSKTIYKLFTNYLQNIQKLFPNFFLNVAFSRRRIATYNS